jgi:DNA-binding response OmpR family regulator
MRNAGRVVLRRDLVKAVWGAALLVDQNNLDVTVSSLRSRLDKGGSRRLIHTVRGFGYKLDAGGDA